MMETILKKINSLYPLSETTAKALKECVTRCMIPKRTLLVQAYRHTRAAYFIEKGLTRSFWLVDGEEITTSFSSEGDIVFSMDELYYSQPSQEYVETLEDTEAYRISLADLLDLFHHNIELPTGAASSIRTNTGGFTARTRNGLRYLHANGT